ncbi:MAG: TldD/PmbA family protein [Erysipelotrichaceae bacterium]|nr:TldD/PmbA family protein [Erysipelotrichaceae bacterium]
MKLNTSKYLLDKKDDLKKIINILKDEFEYVSILGIDNSGKTFRVSTSGTSITPSNEEDRGFVLRVFQDIGFSEYSFNEVDIDLICNRIREIAKKDREIYLKNNDYIEYKKSPKDEKEEIFYVADVKSLPTDINPMDIINKLTDIHDKTMKKYSELLQVILVLGVTQINKIFLSNNRDLYQSYIYANAYGIAMAQNENGVKVEFMPGSGLMGYELIDEIEELVDIAAYKAVELLKATKIEPGVYDIICDPDFTGLIAHEAFGHGAEMDMFVKNRAKGKEYMNKEVASSLVNMRDGAKSYQEASSYIFDDEGNLGTDTLIIDKGILNSGMNDELTSLLLDIEPTGNGKRESHKRKAYTRMTNTFFEEGNDSLEDMIKSIEYGYLLEGFVSGMEDPKNWGIQCVASKGREIVNGKLSGKIVSPVYLTGYVPELLKNVSMVSKGLKLSGTGYCGKGWKEWVKTSTGGSYIKTRGQLN